MQQQNQRDRDVSVEDIVLALNKMTAEEICSVLRSANKLGTFTVTPETKVARTGSFFIEAVGRKRTRVSFFPDLPDYDIPPVERPPLRADLTTRTAKMIKYETNTAEGCTDVKTKCPYGAFIVFLNPRVEARFYEDLEEDDIFDETECGVGSRACSQCQYFAGDDIEKKEVSCKYEVGDDIETIREWKELNVPHS